MLIRFQNKGGSYEKILSLIMSFALAFGLLSNFPIYATEVEIDAQGNEVLYLDQYTFVISEDELTRQVITYDSDTNEEYVSIYNKETNILTDEMVIIWVVDIL